MVQPAKIFVHLKITDNCNSWSEKATSHFWCLGFGFPYEIAAFIYLHLRNIFAYAHFSPNTQAGDDLQPANPTLVLHVVFTRYITRTRSLHQQSTRKTRHLENIENIWGVYNCVTRLVSPAIVSSESKVLIRRLCFHQ